MEKHKFKEAASRLMDIALENGLELEYRPNFNDELDFVIDLDTEAVDYETLENPTCTGIASYLTVTLPKIVRDEDELKHIAEKEGYTPELDEMISDYNHAAQQLMAEAKPQYLLGVENGHVDKLMWCVWN